MKRLLPVFLAVLPGLSWGQNTLKLWERTIALDATAAQAEFLSNGSFAVLVGAHGTSRIYISTRTNSVTSVTPLKARIKKILADSTGIYAVGEVNFNTFIAKVGFNGALIWSRIMDASSIALPDTPNDLVLSPNGNLIVGGTVQGSLLPYGYVVGLNATTGAIVFRATNGAAGGVKAVGVTQNLQVHATTFGRYWRLSSAGATLQSVEYSGGGIEINDLEAKGDKVYAVGRQAVGNQVSPYLQRRSETGVLIGGGRDRFTVNENLGFDEYSQVLIDSTGRALAAGVITDETLMHTRLARWTTAPTIESSASSQLDGAVLRTGPIALDPFDNVYWLAMYDRTTHPASSIQMIKYTETFSPVFGTLIRQTTNMEAGFSEGMAVDRVSGDFVVPYRDAGGSVKWQLWRQRPVAMTDAYGVPPGNNYVSSHPITANDRYFSECVIEIVTYPIKGGLGMTSTGTFVYTRFIGQTGTDSFVYRLRKNGMPGTTATVVLHLQ